MPSSWPPGAPTARPPPVSAPPRSARLAPASAPGPGGTLCFGFSDATTLPGPRLGAGEPGQDFHGGRGRSRKVHVRGAGTGRFAFPVTCVRCSQAGARPGETQALSSWAGRPASRGGGCTWGRLRAFSNPGRGWVSDQAGPGEGCPAPTSSLAPRAVAQASLRGGGSADTGSSFQPMFVRVSECL